MLCQKCGLKSAVVHYKKTINNNSAQVHLCESCAGVNELMSGFLGIKPQGTRQILKCDFCGLTQNDISSIGKAGCANCYTVFREYLIPIIRRIHGTDTHVGKKPHAGETTTTHPTAKLSEDSKLEVKDPEVKAKESELEILEKAMRQAVLDENYEEAAKLRDEIAKLKAASRREVGKSRDEDGGEEEVITT